ncbi:hypothetical protein CRENBAI_011387 [Crenichthys baileyi]|uniref:Uncharacterized protein n=1 Tax=Crenichthys baileyi TaxID=28760 RepID=A0AAV9R0J5_9TELE
MAPEKHLEPKIETRLEAFLENPPKTTPGKIPGKKPGDSLKTVWELLGKIRRCRGNTWKKTWRLMENSPGDPPGVNTFGDYIWEKNRGNTGKKPGDYMETTWKTPGKLHGNYPENPSGDTWKPTGKTWRLS